jgi:hypothetical protein
MVWIAALGVLDSSSEEGIIGIYLLRIAAAFVLCRSGRYRFAIANGVPSTSTQLLHENIRHRSPPQLKK